MLTIINKIFRRKIPIDHRPSKGPFFLRADNLFARKNNEIFIKKISSQSENILKRGTVIMAPGVACNANLFRMKTNGEILSLDHNQSFANLLAAEGFSVYLYHPSYSERVINRYVSRYCSESQHFRTTYEAPSTLTFDQLVNQELPLLLDFVCQDAASQSLTWIGFSMGGMLAYAYLAKYHDERIRNLVTIGSPVSLSQIITRLIAYANLLSKALGWEEKTFTGAISENFIPLSRIIAHLPSFTLKYNLLSPALYNPTNIQNKALKSFFGKVVEPIPAGLENSLAYIIQHGFTSQSGDFSYLEELPRLKGKRNYLFFYGQLDLLAPPDSIKLAHAYLSPQDQSNLIGVKKAGHIDLIIGRKADHEIWEPTLKWLKEKS